MVKKSSTQSCLLLYADTDSSADMLYFAGISVPDPFIALQVGNKKIGVFNALEYSRALKESDFDKILSLEKLVADTQKAFKKAKISIAEVIANLCWSLKISHIKVPYSFPAILAFELKNLKFIIEPHEQHIFFQEREIKSQFEVNAIKAASKACAAGLFTAETILKAAKVQSGKLYFKGKPLTSESLRTSIEIACLEQGAIAMNTIVAGGNEACDPHCRGSKILRANELIIIDIFPKSKSTGYYADMTRTFLKGKLSEPQKKIVHAVLEAQKLAISKIKNGAICKTIHEAVQQYFEKKGFKTKKVGNHYEGFFHGTGHSLGLEIHETPRINALTVNSLKTGNVITIEPGLYYPGIGGCRIEDTIWVKKEGCSLLSDYHYKWHIDK